MDKVGYWDANQLFDYKRSALCLSLCSLSDVSLAGYIQEETMADLSITWALP
jgi:hypothetical protein